MWGEPGHKICVHIPVVREPAAGQWEGRREAGRERGGGGREGGGRGREEEGKSVSTDVLSL